VRRGVYASMPPLPAIPGIEMSGVIVAAGRDERTLRVGEAVYVSARELVHRGGYYAEYIAARTLLERGRVLGRLLLKP
jgi:NADPH2:quinone reductase